MEVEVDMIGLTFIHLDGWDSREFIGGVPKRES